MMEGSTEEKGVLKLVHLGTRVEIPRKPIIAAEVVRKNPRHCVVWPDVFKFPGIVVKPESVLFPGTVFYIVPNHTIYRLLKASGHNYNQPASQQNQSPENHDHCRACAPRQTLPPKSSLAGMTPKHKNCDRCLRKQFHYTPGDGVSSEALPEVNAKSRNTYQEFKYEAPVFSNSIPEIRSFRTKEYHCNRNDNHNIEIKCHEQFNVLKSCLWKHDSVQKPHNL